MVKLSLVQFVNGLIEVLQLLQARNGDPSFDDAAIVFPAFAGDMALLFETVKQASHVRVAGNHAVGDDTAGKAVGCRAAKNAENIVLGGGKPGKFNDLFGLLGEPVGGPEDGDKELVLGRGFEALVHGGTIVV